MIKTSKRDYNYSANVILTWLKNGWYPYEKKGVPGFAAVPFETKGALEGTELVNLIIGDNLLDPGERDDERSMCYPEIQVTDESTQEAAYRLARDYEHPMDNDVVALNFASARRPGGGFLSGARAQEEDLCRCSGLYPCLTQESVAPYYNLNREADDLYTDHMIHSPNVPFFRTSSSDANLSEPFYMVITAPAPNTGAFLSKNPQGLPMVKKALQLRVNTFLALCERYDYGELVLGAWGCGVFQTPPELVAEAFLRGLERSNFDRVVFAIYGSSPRDNANRAAFRKAFGV